MADDGEWGVQSEHDSMSNDADSDEDGCVLPVEQVGVGAEQVVGLGECMATQSPTEETSEAEFDSENTSTKLLAMGELSGNPDEKKTKLQPSSASSRTEPMAGFLTLAEIQEWHPNRIWAMVWEKIIRPLEPFKNVRLAGKQPVPMLHYITFEMKNNPVTTLSSSGTGVQRSRGFDVFRRILCRFCGVSWRNGTSSAQTMWKQASDRDRFRWFVLKNTENASLDVALQSLVKGTKRKLAADADPVSTVAPGATSSIIYEACAGIMLTYNMDIGNKDPDLMVMCQKKATAQEFIAYLENSPLHTRIFNSFWDNLMDMGIVMHFKTIGACMELSENAEQPGRVHFHAYLGTSVQGGVGSMASIVRTDIDSRDLKFLECTPHVRLTKPKKNHPKTVCDAVVNGVYYVIAKKKSTVLRRATLWPIKDSCQSHSDVVLCC